MVDHVKFIGVVSPARFFDDSVETMQRILIDFQHFVVRDAVLFRIKVVQVSEHETTCVSNATVGITELPQYIFRNANIVPVIGCRHPETQYFRTIFIDYFLGCNDISNRFGHFAAIGIHHESMG